MKLFTVAEMVAAEQAADAHGHSYAVMMERAGKALADAIIERVAVAGQRVLVLVGPGNNGGDGLVAGRYLAEAGADVAFYLSKARDAASDSNYARIVEMGLFVVSAEFDQRQRVLRTRLNITDILIDALLGTGVDRPISGQLATVLQQVHAGLAERNAALAPPAPTLTSLTAAEVPPAAPRVAIAACDCPSGLNCDNGTLDPLALAADWTITFAGPKRGHFIFPGAAACGELIVADIGIDPAHTAGVATDVATPIGMAALLPPRPRDGHKGTFGSALVVAGSADYWGAPLLSGRAAYRAGCGLVAIAAPAQVRPVVAGQLPEATYPAVPDAAQLGQASADHLLKMMARYDAILIGPGLGSAAGVMEPLLAERDALPPLVVDADGLNYLAQQENWWRLLPANTILTPHPGEMARLVGRGSDAGERLALARRKSAEWGHIVVLKGAYTIVAEPSGSATLVPSASAALAVAGSGDVLAGVIVSLLAQGVVPYAAACLGAYLHATAGEMAAAPLGGAGMLAHEIADSLPAARQRVAAIAR